MIVYVVYRTEAGIISVHAKQIHAEAACKEVQEAYEMSDGVQYTTL